MVQAESGQKYRLAMDKHIKDEGSLVIQNLHYMVLVPISQRP